MVSRRSSNKAEQAQFLSSSSLRYCGEWLEHDDRDLSGRRAAVVGLPPRIGVNTALHIALPLLAVQLTGMHLDRGSSPGDHHVRLRAKVVVPARVGRLT